jgi:ATP-dependent Clp protease ATP-binding subunit ClpA
VICSCSTSAERIREHIERGIDIEKFESQFVDELVDSNVFRPEFLNRFDEIIMFRPLKKDELLQVVDLIIKDVNKTLELQKVSVIVSLDAKEYLVDAGYDPRLGARPMRRVVQRAVENTVAKKVLSGEVEAGGVVVITLEQVQALVSSKQTADKIIEAAKLE